MISDFSGSLILVTNEVQIKVMPEVAAEVL
jgi:hypothetical protein